MIEDDFSKPISACKKVIKIYILRPLFCKSKIYVGYQTTGTAQTSKTHDPDAGAVTKKLDLC